MARRIARPAHVALSALFVVGLLYQVFLAGLGVFESAATFATHRDTGYVLTLVPVLLAVTAWLGGFGRWHVVASIVMLVQFFLQSVLVFQRESVPAIAALHPVNGVLIALIASGVALDAWRRRRAADAVPRAVQTSEASAG